MTLLLLNSFSIILIHAQSPEFAPLGARWWYRIDQETPELYPVYNVFYAESDTIIDGIDAIKISSSDFYADGTSVINSFEYFKRDTSEIAVYRNGSFHTFLNFNAHEGDTITVLDELFNGFFEFSIMSFSKFEYIIDSIRTEFIDGKDLTVFYVTATDDSDYWFGHYSGVQRIVKNVGAINDISLIGMPVSVEFAGGTPHGLYCYNTGDTNISFNGGNCDSLTTQVYTFMQMGTDFKVVETASSLIIKPIIELAYRARLYDITGAIYFEKNSQTEFEINTSNLPTGIYILEIIIHDEKLSYINKYFVSN